ncbi:hypothetical protein PMZ80_009989 [Knufia obscura]|uniref:Uncharacterized protein n=2 Tax=Knufia TaxID=430999 RepID=A0AAN8EHX7_9EURO|nr:hypothetical protein PMZ80_009989 [Knufia obscura]KAK5956079.1 hypothetical protein OHC33_002652 [Knufia fluminis]
MAIFYFKYRTIEALWNQQIMFRSIISEPGITTVIDDDDQTEIDKLRSENDALKKRVKVEDAEEYQQRREKKRKLLETAALGDAEITEDRSAHRRLPAVGDEVIDLE